MSQRRFCEALPSVSSIYVYRRSSSVLSIACIYDYEGKSRVFSHSGSDRCTVRDGALCYLRLRCIMADEVSDSQPVCVSRRLSYTLAYHYVTSMPHTEHLVLPYYEIPPVPPLRCSSLCPPISCLFLRWVL